MKNALEILASTPPKIAFHNARDCASRITELESKLGLAASPPTWNISKANRRISELEAIVALVEKSSPPPETSRALANGSAVLPAGTLDVSKNQTATELCLVAAKSAASKSPERQAEIAGIKAMLPKTSGATQKMLTAKLKDLETN